MTDKMSKINSVRVKLIVFIFASLLVSVLMVIAVNYICGEYVSDIYLSDEAVSRRDKENFQLFSDYIQKNDISSKDVDEISDWMTEHSYLYMIIYNDNSIIYDSGWWDDSYYTETVECETTDASQENDTTLLKGALSSSNDEDTSDDVYNDSESEGENEDEEQSDVRYVDTSERPIKFADKICKVSIIDFSEEKIISAVQIVSIVIVALIFFIVVFIYSSHITKRISALSKEVVRVENVDINSAINIKGNDEISMLARNVDGMRNKIIEQMRNEQIVWKANSDLVTAMSHDIRTPLTVLTGYLNLLKQGEYSSQEDMNNYIGICYDKVLQLKELSDKLFQYFYVFGNSEEKIETESYNASLLFNQVVGEYAFLLDEKGFDIKICDVDAEYCIETNALYLNRLFGNVFSNVEKYADKQFPVTTTAEYKDDNTIIFKVKNKIKPNVSKKESTGIGLLSCKKIAKQIGCSLETIDSGDCFEVKLSFTATKKDDSQC